MRSRCAAPDKAFGGPPVLEGVDLDVPTGTTCVVLGVSGAGKSVMLKVRAWLTHCANGWV